MNNIVRVLREAIKKEKTTIYRVAKAVDVDFSSLYKALKNGGNPGAKTIDKILYHLGYEIKLIKKSKKKGGEKDG